MQYNTIFFDLDHTLWDFESNSNQTLSELIAAFNLIDLGILSEKAFISCYERINEQLWEEYRKGFIDRLTLRNTRFHKALLEFNINDYELSLKLGEYYLKESPLKKNLFPHALEVLRYLQQRYDLHIITNGFNEVQYIKLEQSNLAPYFKHIITSEDANCKKPEPEIFEYALSKTQSTVSKSLMIGDSLQQDIVGARNFGMDQVFFNPQKKIHAEKVSYEIHSLHELMTLL